MNDPTQGIRDKLDEITGVGSESPGYREEPEDPNCFDELNEAGIRFAEFALRHIHGDHLRKVLAVSAAIADLSYRMQDEGGTG